MKNTKYYIKEILLLIFLIFLPKVLHPTLPSTINIIKNFLLIFLNSGVYIVCIIFLINSVLVFTGIYLILNENIKVNSEIILRHRKKTFMSLFIGYFIYLFYLISLLIQKSMEIQMSLGKDMNDIVYTLTVFSIVLLFTLVYLVRRKICLGETNIGTFVLLLLGSAILFETFIGFSPLMQVFEIFVINRIVEEDIATQFFAPYYFSILSAMLLSIIDLRVLSYHK